MKLPNTIALGPSLVVRFTRFNSTVHLWDVYDAQRKIGQVAMAEHIEHPEGWVVINIYCIVKGVMRMLLPILAEYYGTLMSSGIIGAQTSPDAQRMWQGLSAAVCRGDHGFYFQIHSHEKAKNTRCL